MEWKSGSRIRQNTKQYTHRHKAARVLLGGIGTGNISIDSGGRLCDFELFGRPGKGCKFPYSFFAVWCKAEGEEADARLLEAPLGGVCTQALGAAPGELPGLPRFSGTRFSCQYPFVNIAYAQAGYPLRIRAEAFTPFIPLDAEHSGLPAFRITYTLTNRTRKTVYASVCATLPNIGGFTGCSEGAYYRQDGTQSNRLMQQGGLTGIAFCTDGLPNGHLTRGDMALATDACAPTVKVHWQHGGWWDGAEEFWRDFSAGGELNAAPTNHAVGSHIGGAAKKRYVGSLAVKQAIAPGESKTVTFYISWYFPNRYGWWPDGHLAGEAAPERMRLCQNYYATLWRSAWDAAVFFHQNANTLTRHSRSFAGALYSSTLGAEVVESLASAISVIRSPTFFRTADGHFWGWEGCFSTAGSCPGNCTHVYNYAQALAFLFPELERDMRRTEFLTETDSKGEMAFRATSGLSGERWPMPPAADGQLGSILRVYREWKFSGDDTFLRELWPPLVSALEYALRTWDSDGDFVLDEKQHNTYDIEFYGVTSLTNSLLYAALAACAEMAHYLGQAQRANAWRKAAKAGAEKMDRLLWNGEYYRQAISPEDLNRYRYQYGKGCLSDQLLGQTLAHLFGLGYILPKAHVQSAVTAIYEHNFSAVLTKRHSVQRGFAHQDEGGLVLCSWPRGGRPKLPFTYSDEIWTGTEYQVATHLIYEGKTDEALEIIRTLRRRYGGIRRAPLNEVECGFHYARSMAAWGLLVALSGYRFGPGGISFEPRINRDDFACFYSQAGAWGIYVQQRQADGSLKSEAIPLYRAAMAKMEEKNEKSNR